jgi:hypothetical protein
MGVSAGYVRDEALNFEAVAIVDEGSTDSFLVQRALVFDNQDPRLGMDTYCVVRNGRSHYGGVLASCLTGRVLALTLDPTAASDLELRTELELELTVESVADVMEHLPRLLGVTWRVSP